MREWRNEGGYRIVLRTDGHGASLYVYAPEGLRRPPFSREYDYWQVTQATHDADMLALALGALEVSHVALS